MIQGPGVNFGWELQTLSQIDQLDKQRRVGRRARQTSQDRETAGAQLHTTIMQGKERKAVVGHTMGALWVSGQGSLRRHRKSQRSFGVCK